MIVMILDADALCFRKSQGLDVGRLLGFQLLPRIHRASAGGLVIGSACSGGLTSWFWAGAVVGTHRHRAGLHVVAGGSAFGLHLGVFDRL
jgi:hypothetical protein